MDNQSNPLDDSGLLQTQPDAFETPLTIPAGKLDADQYSADDLDGVTESIFGSGNMAYASLQASQTDMTLTLSDALYLGDGDLTFDNSQESGNGSIPVTGDSYGYGSPSSSALESGAESRTDTDRPVDTSSTPHTDNVGSEGNFTNSTIGSVGASTLSSDVGSFSPYSNLNLSSDVTDTHIDNSITTTNTETHVNENNVTNNSIVNTDLGDVIENVTNLGDDILNTLIEGDIGDTINTVTNEIIDITDIVTNEINNLTQTVTNILQDLGVTNITEQVTNITNELTETVTNTVTNIINELLGDGGISIDLVSNVLDTLGTGLHATIDDSIAGQLSTNLVSGGLTSLANDLLGIDIPLVADTGINIGFDLLGGDNVDDGNDISIAGLNTPAIDLDILEDIVGDIDINISLPTNLADADTLLSAVTDLVDGLSDIDLAAPEDIVNIIGDQGLGGALDIIIGDTVLGQDFDTSVDSLLEQIDVLTGGLTGDSLDPVIDVADDLAGGLLGGADEGGLAADGLLDPVINVADDLAGGLLGGADEDGLAADGLLDPVLDVADDLAGTEITDTLGTLEESLNVDDALDLLAGEDSGDALGDLLGGVDGIWTESTIDSGGSLFSDLLGGTDNSGDILPDPSGTIAEGLGILDIPHSSGFGGLGGLGGLFG